MANMYLSILHCPVYLLYRIGFLISSVFFSRAEMSPKEKKWLETRSKKHPNEQRFQGQLVPTEILWFNAKKRQGFEYILVIKSEGIEHST